MRGHGAVVNVGSNTGPWGSAGERSRTQVHLDQTSRGARRTRRPNAGAHSLTANDHARRGRGCGRCSWPVTTPPTSMAPSSALTGAARRFNAWPRFCFMTAYDSAADIGLLILRVVLGLTMAAHGYNKFFGKGGLKGTAGWFDSMGMKPGMFHARDRRDHRDVRRHRPGRRSADSDPCRRLRRTDAGRRLDRAPAQRLLHRQGGLGVQPGPGGVGRRHRDDRRRAVQPRLRAVPDLGALRATCTAGGVWSSRSASAWPAASGSWPSSTGHRPKPTPKAPAAGRRGPAAATTWANGRPAVR